MKKLTEKQVRSIYAACKEGMTRVQAARRFDISPVQVGDICTRKQWSHLKLGKPIARQRNVSRKHGRTNYTDAQVKLAWKLRHSGMSRTEAAKKAGVGYYLFVGLDSGKGWPHLKLGPAWPPAGRKTRKG